MSGLAPGAVPRLRSDVRYRLVDGQAVVIVQEAGEALVLNEAGSRILELVDGERRVADIVRAMREEFEVGAEELKRDVGEHLAELVAAGVVEA